MSAPAPATQDPRDLIRSKGYRKLLVLAAIVGLVVSVASWGFLEGVDRLQTAVYDDLPDALGYASAPLWWPLPWVALAGLLTGLAVSRLPGRGGHVPADGLKAGGPPIGPADLPGVLLAAVSTLSLGLVLGPEGPLIAIGTGLGILAARMAARDASPQVPTLMAAAGSFAAISAIFGSPVVGAVLLIEAAGLGGAMLPLVLLPGLMSAGIGSLVFIGLGSWSGFSTAAWALAPFPLEAYGGPGWGDFGWTVLLSVATAVVVFVIVALARRTVAIIKARIVPLTIVAGLAVGGLAIAFGAITDLEPTAVLFSGQRAFGTMFADAATVSLGTLALLMLFKGLAWGISMGGFRGGPTFPAIFLGAVAGLLAGHLPGYSQTPAVAALVGAACVSVLRLPLASVMIATLLCAKGGLAVTPLVVAGVVVAYLVSEALSALVDARTAQATVPAPPDAGGPAAPAPASG